MTCSGGCGKEHNTTDPPVTPGFYVVRAICRDCYVAKHGEPAHGFVGFINGWLRVVDHQRKEPAS